MFRTMRRFKQQISEDECIRILMTETRGVLSVLGEDGYPYGIPMNHWYNPDDGKLYFHGAKTGHKIDAITPAEIVAKVPKDAEEVYVRVDENKLYYVLKDGESGSVEIW